MENVSQLQALSIQLQKHFPNLSGVFFDFDWKLIFAVQYSFNVSVSFSVVKASRRGKLAESNFMKLSCS